VLAGATLLDAPLRDAPQDACGAGAGVLIPAIDAGGRLYPVEKLAAHRKGLHHLAVSVFVFSGDALLVQRRAFGKYHSEGLWANTCCTHPNWGETGAASAHRRLQEELGLATALRSCAVIDYAADVGAGMREWERVEVFRGDVDQSTAVLAVNPAEVSAVSWRTVDDLTADARERPHLYAPWFRIYLSRWLELRLTAP
jgi:isopentenyl-diphosphate delta-isomerase